MSKLPQNATVVVTTGEVAKFFDLTHVSGEPKLRFDSEMTPGNLADQGPSGKTPPDQSAAESMEATFSKILAEKLYSDAYGNTFDSLILVADPDTLGEIRPLLHKEVIDKLALEVDKTLINAPVDDVLKSIVNAA